MSYEQIMELTDERNLNRIVPSLSDEEAIQYYGNDFCDFIERLYSFCRKSEYTIYQHATNIESADNIMSRGFLEDGRIIDKLPIDVHKVKVDSIELNKDGIKTKLYDGGQYQLNEFSSFYDQLSDRQHFFENTNCNIDYGSLTNPNVNRNLGGNGATVLFAVSKNVLGFRSHIQYGIVESYYDDVDDRQIPELYFERLVVPSQFCIGYIDVKNKRFIANPNFKFNYDVTDEFVLGTSSISGIDLSNDLKRRAIKK